MRTSCAGWWRLMLALRPRSSARKLQPGAQAADTKSRGTKDEQMASGRVAATSTAMCEPALAGHHGAAVLVATG
jgi:hypothetical protein